MHVPRVLLLRVVAMKRVAAAARLVEADLFLLLLLSFLIVQSSRARIGRTSGRENVVANEARA